MNTDRLNEWKQSRRKRKNLDAGQLVEQLKSGDTAALSTAITLVESQLESDRQIAEKLIDACLPHAGNSIRIGITGVPGVGKSSFIEAFGKLVVERGGKLAVLAIDPSSERTGGSILGDKTRMQDLSVMKNVFIRPSASGTNLGGVARMTREAILLCEAAGYTTIFIETVGVGQSETVVHSMVDFFLLLLLAGAGDELQGIKRGIMEMADGIAITKADGENEKRAAVAAREVKNAIHLFPPAPSGWIPEVHTISSATGHNLEVILEMIGRFEDHLKINGHFAANRSRQELNWLQDTLKSMLLDQFQNNPSVQALLQETERQVSSHEITPFHAAEKLIKAFRS